MKHHLLLLAILLCSGLSAKQQKTQPINERQLWLSYMDKVARPVIQNIAEDKLKATMPIVLSPKIDNPENRTRVAYLEAFARTLCGISPWLNLEGGSPEEVALRNQYRAWALKGITNAVNPEAKDYLQWKGGQPLVDASFFALALIRSPWLWEHLSDTTRQQVVTALKSTRATIPVYTNWILFTGMIEAFFCKYDQEYDAVRLEYGIREFSQHWYTGDGMFSDGMNFNLDYYNSYVIQPFLCNILETVSPKNKSFNWFQPKLDKISKRYADIQERSVNADGSFPIYGRSITYRGGAFHHLADMTLRKQLPAHITPAQVKGALTAVLKKTLGAPNTFNAKGYLNIGLYGSQTNLADFYINTGSLYLCSTIFLPLGLPDTDEFWATPSAPWTSAKVWSGQDVPADHALELR